MLKKLIIGTLFCLIIDIGFAQAEPLPPEALDKEYQSCMGATSGSGESDDQKKAYCLCVREQLARDWDTNTAEQFGAAHATGKDDPGMLAKLQAIGNECVSKVLK